MVNMLVMCKIVDFLLIDSLKYFISLYIISIINLVNEWKWLCYSSLPFLLILIIIMTEEVVKNCLHQYKIGKAFQYFQSEWLKETFDHPVDMTTPYCFLRAECTPSQCLRSEPHKVWVCLAIDSGEVKSAFCTCTAV